jgi:hydroxyacylglutathione hydrolase
MIFEQIAVGGDRNFAYLIGDEETRAAAVIDPAYRPDLVLERASAHGLEIAYLINTHSHFDHAGGNAHILERTKARAVCGARDLPASSPAADRLTRPGGAMAPASATSPPGPMAPDSLTLPLGRITLTLIPTPGHTDDSLCILAEEPGSPGKLMTGDTLFVGKVGGTDYGEGARAEYDSLHLRLMVLPAETEVWPGHDVGVRPHSTIGEEARANPFLLCRDFAEFAELKKNWLEYKKAHGIK